MGRGAGQSRRPRGQPGSGLRADRRALLRSRTAACGCGACAVPAPCHEVRDSGSPTSAGAVAASAALLWFGPLDAPHLFEPDEGRYAEIPREMVASGDWVTPRLNAIKYFEKPALQYWATAGAFTLFGQHAWTARLWPALCGYAGLLLTWLLCATALWSARRAVRGHRAGERVALYGAVANRHARYVPVLRPADGVVRAGAAGAAARRADAMPPRRRSAGAAASCSASGLAFAVLSKGLVGVLIPGAAAALYLLWQRDWTLAAARAALVERARAGAARGAVVSRGVAAQPRVRAFLLHRAALSTLSEPRRVSIATSRCGSSCRYWHWGFCPGRRCCRARCGRAGAMREAAIAPARCCSSGRWSCSHSSVCRNPSSYPTSCRCCRRWPLLTGKRLADISAAQLARHLLAVAIGAGAIGCAVLLLWALPAAAALVETASQRASQASPRPSCCSRSGRRPARVWRVRASRLPRRWLPASGAGCSRNAPCWPPMNCRACARSSSSKRARNPGSGTRPASIVSMTTCSRWPSIGADPARWLAIAASWISVSNRNPGVGSRVCSSLRADWQRQSDALAILRPEDYRQLAALGLPMRVIYTAQSLVAVVRR